MFIELTTAYTNTKKPLIINVDQIVAYYRQDRETMIFLNGNHSFPVKETPSQITRMIQEAAM
tara:strand:- start:2189 stop:2374 length:186 start_codon:yes stop_codon:yes gene_type:complete